MGWRAERISKRIVWCGIWSYFDNDCLHARTLPCFKHAPPFSPFPLGFGLLFFLGHLLLSSKMTGLALLLGRIWAIRVPLGECGLN